ncbi:MAG: hypothetical protein O7G29_12230 [Acidobacteria bacterium]|nr:hypothetical protein [Acidobacteriota bacterium]
MGKTAKEQKERFENIYKLIDEQYVGMDHQLFRLAWAAVHGHLLGFKSWLLLVAPPSTGKTEGVLESISSLQEVKVIDKLTEHTLISGMYKAKTPGVLEKAPFGGKETRDGDKTIYSGGDGILVFKDFSTVSGMKHESRGELFSQLRRIHDGQLADNWGTGESKLWSGRVSVIAASTPAIDNFPTFEQELGARFLRIRGARVGLESARKAIENLGTESAFHKKLHQLMEPIFANALRQTISIKTKQTDQLSGLAELVAVGRGVVVIKDGEVVKTPEPEGPGRVAKELATLAKALAALEGRRVVLEKDVIDVCRVALDTLPQNRCKLLLAAVAPEEIDLTGTDLPRRAGEWAYEQLYELKLLSSKKPLSLGIRGTEIMNDAGIEKIVMKFTK